MPRASFLLPVVTALFLATVGVALGAESAPHDFAKWEKDIAAFEQADRTSPPLKGALLFTGASTITKWKSLAADYPALPVLNRGFGGSEIIDVTHFADRYIFPVAPRAIYFRSGGNDLFRGKSVEQVFADFKALVAAIHAKLPTTDFIVISLNPSIARWTQSPQEKTLNDLEAAYLKGRSHCGFIDVWDIVLGSDGKPRPELFVADKLHFNEAGYQLLAERVRTHLPK